MFNLNSRIDCYCAFCRSPRKVHKKKRINLMNIAVSGIGAVAIMYLIFHAFHPLVFFLFVGFMIASEVFVQFRWRISMICKHCGFDPVLYIKDVNAAAEKVKIHLEKRKNDPTKVLARPLNLPKVNPKAAELKKQLELQTLKQKNKGKTGALVSKQV